MKYFKFELLKNNVLSLYIFLNLINNFRKSNYLKINGVGNYQLLPEIWAEGKRTML